MLNNQTFSYFDPNEILIVPRIGDAGFDLKTPHEIIIEPNSLGKIMTGLHISIPLNWVGLIRERSSLALRGIHTPAGVIDSSYRGEVVIVLRNFSSECISLKVGEKVAQLLVIQHLSGEVATKVNSLSDLSVTERGAGGFGSTGV